MKEGIVYVNWCDQFVALPKIACFTFWGIATSVLFPQEVLSHGTVTA